MRCVVVLNCPGAAWRSRSLKNTGSEQHSDSDVFSEGAPYLFSDETWRYGRVVDIESTGSTEEQPGGGGGGRLDHECWLSFDKTQVTPRDTIL